MIEPTLLFIRADFVLIVASIPIMISKKLKKWMRITGLLTMIFASMSLCRYFIELNSSNIKLLTGINLVVFIGFASCIILSLTIQRRNSLLKM